MDKYAKNRSKPVQKYRFGVQTLFTLLCIWIGVEFYCFIQFLNSNGIEAYYNRPPGVEGFLPISSLMSVYYFVLTGNIHQAHPAGFFIFLAILSVSFLFGKSFCSWLCPVGFISELIGDFGDKIYNKLFKHILRLPKWIDYPLRALKYLLLAFFVYSIFFSMSALALKYFLDTPYNIMADVKMYKFFAELSRFSLIVIASLFVLSIVIRNFWCRFLCPFGALLGLTGLLGPFKIKRNTQSCINCGLCSRACNSSIKVNKLNTVISDECTSCMSCVDACPVADTLELKLAGRKRFSKIYIVSGIILVFVSVTGIGMITGNWKNNISKKTYLEYYRNIDALGHPAGNTQIEELNKISGRGETDAVRREKKHY
jgi:polyferredoxin